MNEEQDFDNFEDQEADHVAEELLRDAMLFNDDPLNDAGEQFNKDTIVLLLGLGLTGEEIKHFQKHEIGLEKFRTLTRSDLDYIGITSYKKQKNIIDCIKKIHKQDEKKSQPPLESNSDLVFRSEDSQAMDNVFKHQQTLIKIIPYFKKGLNTKLECTFFQPGISVNHTFEKVALCCVQQTRQVHNQLCMYLHELEENTSQPQKKKNKLWSQQNWKWWFLAFMAGSCIPLFVWGSRKVTDLPAQWTKMWHLQSHPVPGR